MFASTFDHYLHYYFDWLTHLHPLNKFILGLILKTIHLLFSFLAAFGPFITNNIRLLTLLILYYITLLTGWYLFGYCCCTALEEKLDGSTKNNKNSFISDTFENIIGKHNSTIIQAFVVFTPFFNTLVCLYKINYYCCKRK